MKPGQESLELFWTGAGAELAVDGDAVEVGWLLRPAWMIPVVVTSACAVESLPLLDEVGTGASVTPEA